MAGKLAGLDRLARLLAVPLGLVQVEMRDSAQVSQSAINALFAHYPAVQVQLLRRNVEIIEIAALADDQLGSADWRLVLSACPLRQFFHPTRNAHALLLKILAHRGAVDVDEFA